MPIIHTFLFVLIALLFHYYSNFDNPNIHETAIALNRRHTNNILNSAIH